MSEFVEPAGDPSGLSTRTALHANYFHLRSNLVAIVRFP
jgi:hypothetical protein